MTPHRFQAVPSLGDLSVSFPGTALKLVLHSIGDEYLIMALEPCCGQDWYTHVRSMNSCGVCDKKRAFGSLVESTHDPALPKNDALVHVLAATFTDPLSATVWASALLTELDLLYAYHESVRALEEWARRERIAAYCNSRVLPHV